MLEDIQCLPVTKSIAEIHGSKIISITPDSPHKAMDTIFLDGVTLVINPRPDGFYLIELEKKDGCHRQHWVTQTPHARFLTPIKYLEAVGILKGRANESAMRA